MLVAKSLRAQFSCNVACYKTSCSEKTCFSLIKPKPLNAVHLCTCKLFGSECGSIAHWWVLALSTLGVMFTSMLIRYLTGPEFPEPHNRFDQRDIMAGREAVSVFYVSNDAIHLRAPQCIIQLPLPAQQPFDSSLLKFVAKMRRLITSDSHDFEVVATDKALSIYKDTDIWLEMMLDDGRSFYHNPKRGRSQWARPKKLMTRRAAKGGWHEYTEAGGRLVWYHPALGWQDSLPDMRSKNKRGAQIRRHCARPLLPHDVTLSMFVKSVNHIQ